MMVMDLPLKYICAPSIKRLNPWMYLLLIFCMLLPGLSMAADGQQDDDGFDKVKIGHLALGIGHIQVMDKWGQHTTLVNEDPLHQGDMVRTGLGSSAQLRFLDGTTLSMGEEARTALDQYRFDPQANEGAMAATIFQGILHYRSGQLGSMGQNRDHTVIRMPRINMGIRGSEWQGEVTREGTATIVHEAGTLRLSDSDGNLIGTLSSRGSAFEMDQSGQSRFFSAGDKLLQRLEQATKSVRPAPRPKSRAPVGASAAPSDHEGARLSSETIAEALTDNVILDPEKAGDLFKKALADGLSRSEALEAVLQGLRGGDREALREILRMAADEGMTLEEAKGLVEKMRIQQHPEATQATNRQHRRAGTSPIQMRNDES